MPKNTTIDGDRNLEDLRAEWAGASPALCGAAATEARRRDWNDAYHVRLAEVRKAR